MRGSLFVLIVIAVIFAPFLADTKDSNAALITDPTITPTTTPTTVPPTNTPLPPTVTSTATPQPFTPTPTVNLAQNYFDSAFDAYERGDYQKAIEDYTRSLEIGGYYEAFAYNNRGLAYSNLGQYNLAIADFTSAILLDSNYYQAYQNRAWAYYWSAEYRLAIEDAEASLQIQPDQPFSYYLIALANEGLEDYEEALINYDRAIESDPNYVDAYLARGILRDRFDDQLGAASDYYTWLLGVETDRRFETILSGSATLDMAEGRQYIMTFSAEAGQVLAISATAREENMDPLFVVLDGNGVPLIGDDDDGGGLNASISDYVITQSGFYTLVVGHAGGGSLGTVDVTLVLDSAPPAPTEQPLITPTFSPSPTAIPTPTPFATEDTSAQNYFDSAFDAYERGDYQKAIDDYTRSLEIGGYYEDFAHHNRGLAYYNLERYEDALADFNAAIRLNDTYTSAYYMRALTHEQLDNRELALEDFNRAIELEPENSDIWLSRGIFYENDGLAEQAGADFWQYIQLIQTERITAELPSDNIVSLELSFGRVYAIPIRGEAGQLLTIGTDNVRTTDVVDSLLVLLGTDGTALVGNDDGGRELNAHISDFVLPTTGDYTIVVSHAGGNSDGMISVSVAISTADSGDAQDNLNRGHDAFREGDYTSALNFYDTAYNRDNILEALYWRGRVYAATENYNSALADYSAVISAQPDFSAAYISRGRVYQALGRNDMAAGDFYLWLELQSRNTDPIVLDDELISADITQNVTLEAGQYATIFLDLRVGQRLTAEATSEDGDPLLVLITNKDANPLIGDDDSGGGLNARIEDYPIAESGFYSLLVGSGGSRSGGTMTINISLTAASKTAEEYFAEAYALRNDDPITAIDLFNQAIARNPAYTEAYYWRGRAYRDLENYPSMLRDFSLAILTDDEFSLTYLSRGLYYDQIAQDTAAAARDYYQWLLLTTSEQQSGVLFSNNPLEQDLATGVLYHFTFAGVAGDVVTISAIGQSGNPDPLLVLLDANNTPIAGNDDSGGRLDALINNFTLPSNGRYTLLMGRAAAGNDGTVQITLQK